MRIVDKEELHQFNLQNAQKNQRPKISLGVSVAILVLVICGLIALFSGLHASGWGIDSATGKIIGQNYPGVFTPHGKSGYAYYLGYFSVIMNIIAAGVAIATIVDLSFVVAGKIPKVHKWAHMLNMVSATNLFVNFLFSLFYLMPVAAASKQYYFVYVFTGSNLIFNFFVPFLGVLQFIYFFKVNPTPLRECFYSIIPGCLYWLIYMCVALCNITPNEATIIPECDLYLFGYVKYELVIFGSIVMMAFIVGSAVLIWYLNKRIWMNRYVFIFAVNLSIAIMVPLMTILMFYFNCWAPDADWSTEGFTCWQQTFGARFLFYTHWSNWLLGIACTIQCVYIMKIIRGKECQIPAWVSIVKLGTVAIITLTLLLQFIVCLKWATTKDVGFQEGLNIGYVRAFGKHLIFEHFLIPVFGIISFIVLEHKELKLRTLFISSSFISIYVLIYLIVICAYWGTPLRNKIDSHYITPWDVYNASDIIRKIFGQNCSRAIFALLFPLLTFISYALMFLINWLYWLCNRKIHFEQPKAPSWREHFKELIANHRAKKENDKVNDTVKEEPIQQ